MKLQELQNKKILILGYGREGRATEAYLRSVLPGVSLSYTDRNLDPRYLERQKDFDLVIKTPGIPKKLVTVPYTTATNIFFANCTNPVIGVTGSKGKSTTSSLIYHILKEAGRVVHLVGNIGTPALEVLKGGAGKEDIFVMELSSYQLDDILYSPHVSVVLNLFPEHMNYHGGLQAYYAAKKNIIRFAGPNDYFVYNPQYPELNEWAKESACTGIPVMPRLDSTEGTALIGRHNLDNLNAALAVASLMQVPEETARRALAGFQPLRHRLERVGEYAGITFWDDAISTTPQSTLAALEALGRVDTLFLGGQDRGYDFTGLAGEVARRQIPNIVLFPESGSKIGALLRQSPGYEPQVLETSDMKEAVDFAFSRTKAGGVCLLSTASPSYSVWKNFEEKGDLYQQWIRNHEKN